MQKYNVPLLARLNALLDVDQAHRQISISAGDLLGWCLVAYEQADGACYARHRLRARWLQRDVLRMYGHTGYVPIERKYFVAGLRDAVGQMQRDIIAHVVQADP